MKTYVIAATILAIVTLLVGTYRAGNSQGKLATHAKYKQVVLAHRERENGLLLLLKQAKKERDIVYRDRLRSINTANGDCLDRTVPESITRILHDTNGG